ncbi:MAG: stalk domain-containing protein [Peptoanaerobacter stomatis]
MKRKLSLLMAFMMAATLLPAQPAFAASRNSFNKSVSATSDDILDETTGVVLTLAEDSATIKGAKAGDYFELQLSGDAKWTFDSSAWRRTYEKVDNVIYPTKKGVQPTAGTHITGLRNVEVRKMTDSILGVKVLGLDENNNPDSSTLDVPGDLTSDNHVKQITIPMMVDMNGTPEGAQKVTVVPKNSELSGGEYSFSNVGDTSIRFRVQKKEKISRSGNTKVQLILEEMTQNAFKDGRVISLKLPRGFTWDDKGPKADPFSGPSNATVKTNKDDARILDITVTGATGNLDTIYTNIAIIPDRDARFGDVDVVLQGTGASDVSPSSLVVAEYVDYGVQVKAEKVLNVIAGKDIEGLYKSKITIEEPATSSLQGNRYMTFTFADENGKEVDASLQHGETLKVTRKSGDTNTSLQIDKSSIEAVSKESGKDTSYTANTFAKDKKNSSVKNPENKMANKFDLYVTNQSEKARTKFELEVPFVVDSGFTGKLFLKVKGAGAEEQLVQIADVKAPVTFEVKGALPQVKIGLQKQDGQDILVKETEAGALQDYIPDVTNDYAEYNLKFEDTNIQTYFKSVAYTLDEGNIGIKKVDKKDKYIYVQVDRRSTKPSAITFKNISVTLDRSVPYGELRLKGNFGVVDERHDLSKTVKKFDYFTTITPVSDEKRITTVFTIGEKSYTEVVRGVKEAKTADVAPFIKDNRTMLPVRYIADAIGAVVNYDPTTRIATFQKYQSVVTMNIDKNVMYVNGSPVQLDAKPTNVEGRIFLPVANIAQAFGLKHGETIIWNADNKTVTILPQDATPEEIKAAKEGTILKDAVEAKPAEAPKAEEKPAETPAK